MNKLVLKQEASLNQYLLQPEPVTMAKRLEWLKLWSAFILPFMLLLGASLLFKGWAKNQPVEVLPFIGMLLLGWGALSGTCMLLPELNQRLAKNSRRRLEMSKRTIYLFPGGFGHWKHIAGWHLDSVSGRPDLQKLTLIRYRMGKDKPPNLWSLILQSPEQTEAFLNHLKSRAQAGKQAPRQYLELPALPVPKKMNPLGWLLLSSGLCLFNLSILPLISAAILAKRSNIEFNLNMLNTSSGNLEAFILNHFNSSHELCWTVICLGLLCTLLALALAMIGQRLSFYPSQSEDAVSQAYLIPASRK